MWLWMFTWTFICSYHMFRVFTAQTRSAAQNGVDQRVWRRVAFSLSCPAAIVMIIILTNYFTSGGTELGYGEFSCYLNSTFLVSVALVGPLSITTAVNIILFLIVVYKIYKVQQIRSAFRNDDQQVNWYVYVKLSSVTGAFWTVAIAAAALDSGVLSTTRSEPRISGDTFETSTILGSIAPCILNKGATNEPLPLYQWNRSQHAPFDYLDRYCLWRCNGGIKVEVFSTACWNLECVPCYCQRPACEIYKNCCPDITVPCLRDSAYVNPVPDRTRYLKSQSLDTISGDRPRIPPLVGCDAQTNQEKSSLFIRSCSQDYKTNRTVIDLCEKDKNISEQTVETFVRALDMKTHVVYKNKYCATCNRVENFFPLPIRFVFASYKTVSKVTDYDDLLRQLLSLGLKPAILFPDNVTVFDCKYSETKQVLNSCKSTNETKLVDEVILRACEGPSANYHQVYDTEDRSFYKNIFCYICNKFSFPYQALDCLCHDGSFSFKPLPFSLLLDLREKTRSGLLNSELAMKSTSCSMNQWLSPEGLCVELSCSPGKTYLNGVCSEIIEDIRGLSYSLQLWLEPDVTDTQNGTCTNLFPSGSYDVMEIAAMLYGLCEEFIILLQGIHDQSHSTVNLSLIYWTEFRFIGNFSFSRTPLETQVLQRFTQGNIVLETYNTSLEFKTSPLFRNGKHYVNNLHKYLSVNKDLIIVSKKYQSNNKDYLDYVNDFTAISELLLCPNVRFNHSDFKMTINESSMPPTVDIIIDLHVMNISIADAGDLKMAEVNENGELCVCQELLNSKVESLKDNLLQEAAKLKMEGIYLAEYILSIICFVASMASLLLTLLTYAVFTVLRTEAGINNMFLSGSLLLAQLSLLASSHIFRSSTECTVLGVTTHFMWLWMFTWTFICSHHMFKVFTALTRPVTHCGPGGLWKKIALSVSCPFAVVMVTALTNYLTSDGSELGYGMFSCYLNSTFLVGVTLVGPLSIATAVNILLFLIAVYKIYKVQQLRSAFRNDDQQVSWYVYIKLSSVTGAFWTVAIAAAALDSSVLRFISIILNGLQGVAIFISFICNQRVAALYRELLGKLKRRRQNSCSS
ncbi:hypothetical protein Btru_025103 [Bulinus truncatus]|nr:hypothetical protein Btru_025103 [Bulinus truncatus]